MAKDEEDAAAKIQAIKRGKNAREDVEKAKAARKMQSMQRGKKSRKGGDKLEHAVKTLNVALLERLIDEGAVATPEALKLAIASPARAMAMMLISEQTAWGVDFKELEVWNKVQDASAPPGDEEEEPEEVDVAGEEWQTATATEIYGTDPDGIYKVKGVVAVGVYAGERAEADPVAELAFDTEVQARGILMSQRSE